MSTVTFQEVTAQEVTAQELTIDDVKNTTIDINDKFNLMDS